MLSRLLFLLLLAANVGVAAWLYVGARAPKPAALPAADPGVAELVLLSEREPASDADAAELASAPASPGDQNAQRCVTLGPFASQADVRRALNALTPAVDRIQFREAQSPQSRGFAVFLPAPATREEALRLARQLSAKGVRDYYVVTAGAQQNTISLGLFRDRINADKRRDQVGALGFAPTVAERNDNQTVFWLDYAAPRGASVDWRARLPDQRDIAAHETRCF